MKRCWVGRKNNVVAARVFCVVAVLAIAASGCVARQRLSQNKIGQTRAKPGDAPWPMFQHDPMHTGRSSHRGPRTPRVKWTFNTVTIFNFWRRLQGSTPSDQPAIGPDGSIYFVGWDDMLYAVGPDGSKKWTFGVDGGMDPAVTIGEDGTAYCCKVVGGALYALDKEGNEKWRFRTGEVGGGPPVLGRDGTIYVAGCDKFYALRPDGTRKWAFLLGETESASSESLPALGPDGTIYFGSSDGLYALRPDGTKKWFVPTRDEVSSSPAVGPDGTVHFSSLDGTLWAVTSSGKTRWRFRLGQDIAETAVGRDGTIYFGRVPNWLYALKPDGSVRWRFRAKGQVHLAPAIDKDGAIYFSDDKETLYALREEGTRKWELRQAVASAMAIAHDGTIYFDSGSGITAVGE